jgi:hypothetical protein
MEPYLSDLLEGTGCVLVKSRLTGKFKSVLK